MVRIVLLDKYLAHDCITIAGSVLDGFFFTLYDEHFLCVVFACFKSSQWILISCNIHTFLLSSNYIIALTGWKNLYHADYLFCSQIFSDVFKASFSIPKPFLKVKNLF